ncbi:MAG: monovalent cation/H+ antiporter complex subunit F [Candidatus Desulfofervidaceae bacterium]|nr:monovalent cation/H+ antiporter complex subunit F [Candidatus Desulfofervidaceae bacterium]
MTNLFLAIGLAISFLALLCFYRVVYGPGVLNRIIAVNVVGTKTTVVLVLMAFIYARVDMFVDISLAYALLNFIGTIAIAKFFEKKGEV